MSGNAARDVDYQGLVLPYVRSPTRTLRARRDIRW